MASSSIASSKPSKAPSKVLCKYYMSNCCFKGNLCPFSHDWKDKPDMRCKYYMKGTCILGKNCRYDHVKPPEEETPGGPPRDTMPRPTKTLVPAPANLPPLSSTTSKMASPSSPSSSVTPPANTSHKLVTLRDDPSRNPKKWVQATEFVPGKLFHGHIEDNDSEESNMTSLGHQGVSSSGGELGTYSDVLGAGLNKFLDVISAEEAAGLLCPFAEMGHCPFETCEYLHGDVCDMCNRECLNPFDPEQQAAHRKECLKMHEDEMERAFQVQESQEKQCAVCMEYVVTKVNPTERRFGILVNCDHCFCLSCIRKWRSSTHTQNKTIRACPLCRKVSFFVIPSEVWIDDEAQKEKLIQKYKENLEKKHCKHFNMGEGTCPFGSSCFYKHEYPDGRKAEGDSRFYEDAEGEKKAIKSSTLWDYLNSREEMAIDSDQAEDWDNPPGLPDAPGTYDSSNNNSRNLWLGYEPDIDELDIL